MVKIETLYYNHLSIAYLLDQQSKYCLWYTFYFLINGLCNSYPNCLLKIVSLSIAPPEQFLLLNV